MLFNSKNIVYPNNSVNTELKQSENDVPHFVTGALGSLLQITKNNWSSKYRLYINKSVCWESHNEKKEFLQIILVERKIVLGE